MSKVLKKKKEKTETNFYFSSYWTLPRQTFQRWLNAIQNFYSNSESEPIVKKPSRVY